RAKEAVAEGFTTVYYKVGVEEERDVELVVRTREMIGKGPKLRVDANEAWTPGTAVRILRRMAPAVIEYIEQPTLMHALESLAEDYVVEPLLYRGGKMAISERPGLGVEIDPDKLARFAEAFERDGMAISYAASRGGRILAVPNQ